MTYCECGCGEVVNAGRSFLQGHNGRCMTKETRTKLSIIHKGKRPCLGHKQTKEHKENISKALKGRKLSKEHILNRSISQTQCRKDDYCDAWADKEYKKSCKKDYCELCRTKLNPFIQKDGKLRSNLSLHHANLNKEDCRPNNIKTLCNSCHAILHNKIRFKKESR